MIKKILSWVILSPLAMHAQTVIVEPMVKQPTAFAIITDQTTYDHTKEALFQYKSAVEADGLATYLVSSDWDNPDEVKQAIRNLYKRCPALEGFVLVGDIPVAFVRNAQHLTTAFKMNEKTFAWHQSSVPTDRFYDDLHLEFDFIKQDSLNPTHFYYQLRETSPQQLNPTFYSARIKYPEQRGGDKYAAIAAYLKKAAAAKADKKNQVDQVFAFNGGSYNSDCLMVWMDDEKAYKENFPLAFGRKQGFRHWNFRMNHPMKYHILNELQRKDLDIFMFHEHGMPTGQLINDELACTHFYDRYKMLKSSLYNAVMGHVGKRDKDTVRLQMQQKRHLTDEFFKDLDDSVFWNNDSTHYADERIVTDDMLKYHLSTNPRFIMFDACYNGSFHEKDYIAGHYVFNDGQTIVAQGNTRNVLQDRWTIEMLGLLSHGMRVGQYNKLIATLEGHLLGDPTFRFAPIEENSLTTDVTLRAEDSNYWKQLLDSPYADVQCLAMRMLADADSQKELAPLFLSIYKNSLLNTVRMEAIKLLSRYRDSHFVEALRLGLNDSYEMVARQSAIYAGFVGDEVLLPAIVYTLIENNERLRVQMSANKALTLYPKEKVWKAIEDFYLNADRMHKEVEKERLLRSLNKTCMQAEQSHQILMDVSMPDSKRISVIRSVRNYPYHPLVEDYLKVVKDHRNSLEVRVVMAEALGWFSYSVQRLNILQSLKQWMQSEDLPKELRGEIEQNINRLIL